MIVAINAVRNLYNSWLLGGTKTLIKSKMTSLQIRAVTNVKAEMIAVCIICFGSNFGIYLN